MRVIHKYQLEKVVFLPKDAQILKVGMQNGIMYLWAMIDTNQLTLVERHFEIVGTGQSFQYNDYLDKRFIDTIFDGPFVWHIWELN